MKKNTNTIKVLFPYIILSLVIIGTLYFFNLTKIKVNELSYNELITEMSSGEVSEITVTERTNAAVYVVEGKLKDYKETEYFKSVIPLSEKVMEKILVYADNQGFKVNTETNPENNSIISILISIIPIVLLVLATFWLFTKVSGGNNKSMDFGRSKAKLSEDGSKVKFTDVAG